MKSLALATVSILALSSCGSSTSDSVPASSPMISTPQESPEQDSSAVADVSTATTEATVPLLSPIWSAQAGDTSVVVGGSSVFAASDSESLILDPLSGEPLAALPQSLSFVQAFDDEFFTESSILSMAGDSLASLSAQVIGASPDALLMDDGSVVARASGVTVATMNEDIDPMTIAGDVAIGRLDDQTIIGFDVSSGSETWQLIVGPGGMIGVGDVALIIAQDGSTVLVDPSAGTSAPGPTFPAGLEIATQTIGAQCGLRTDQNSVPQCSEKVLLSGSQSGVGLVIEIATGRVLNPASCDSDPRNLAVHGDLLFCLDEDANQLVAYESSTVTEVARQGVGGSSDDSRSIAAGPGVVVMTVADFFDDPTAEMSAFAAP